MWDTAQTVGAGHASARDEPGLAANPAPQDLPAAVALPLPRVQAADDGHPGRSHPDHPGYVYYGCPYNPQNPRHAAAAPDHPRTVRVREDDLLTVIREFFATRIFGPDRAAMLAARLRATAAEDTARLHKRLKKIDAAESAHAREIENLASLPQGAPAITALRTRIIERFSELETERTQTNDRLAALQRATGQRDEPGLLDALTMLGDILADTPASLQAQLFAAFGLELIYNKEDHQVSIHATITPSTPTPSPTSSPAANPHHPRRTICPFPTTPQVVLVGTTARPGGRTLATSAATGLPRRSRTRRRTRGGLPGVCRALDGAAADRGRRRPRLIGLARPGDHSGRAWLAPAGSAAPPAWARAGHRGAASCRPAARS
jgi:hypothetical protein